MLVDHSLVRNRVNWRTNLDSTHNPRSGHLVDRRPTGSNPFHPSRDPLAAILPLFPRRVAHPSLPLPNLGCRTLWLLQRGARPKPSWSRDAIATLRKPRRVAHPHPCWFKRCATRPPKPKHSCSAQPVPIPRRPSLSCALEPARSYQGQP